MRIVLATVVVVVAILRADSRIPQVPFHPDEAEWILAGNYYSDLLVRGDFTHSEWVANHLRDVGNLNPQLGKLLLGMGIRMHPNRQPGDAEYRGQYDWGKSQRWNYDNGNVPQVDFLLRAREASSVFAVGCALILFLIGTVFVHEVAGVLAAALFLSTNWMLDHLVRAMTDGYYNFFLLCGLLASAGLVRSHSTRSLAIYSSLMGLAAALACSVKIIGLPLLVLFYVPAWLYVTTLRWPGWKAFVIGPVCFGIASVIPVYVLNPFLWPTESWTILVEFPRLFFRWREVLTSVPGERWPDPPGRMSAIHERLIASDSLIVPGERLFIVIGIALCLYLLFRAVRNRRSEALPLLLVYGLAQYGFIAVMLQFNWKRYYLPTLFSMKLLAAAGLIGTALLLIRYWNERPTQEVAESDTPRE